MEGWYGEDLAYVHDVGFSGYALGAAPGILGILARGGIREGLVVDLVRLTKPFHRVRCAYAETTGYRRTVGGRRTALAEAAAQAQGRTPSHR
jgi:hypothetical protein